MRPKSLIPAALAALVLAGCGSQQPGTPQPTGPPRAWTLADFLRLSGIRRDSDHLTYRLPAHPRCTALTILRSTDEVESYTASGDVIATNPDRSAGVKVEPEEPASCRVLFTRALAQVR
ncbi:MAG: hypothetical protein QOH72_3313 [Solirubrobacteraceae bacterium]|nr:hypothetical protein [Solirubrobacteraceae bacterium]